MLESYHDVAYRLSAAQMAEIQVINSNLDTEMVEGSNAGNVASDHDERLQHAPAVVSPLTDEESSICMQLYRCGLVLYAYRCNNNFLHQERYFVICNGMFLSCSCHPY